MNGLNGLNAAQKLNFQYNKGVKTEANNQPDLSRHASYAEMPSGSLLKAMYCTAVPSASPAAEIKKNSEYIKNTSFAESLEDYEVKNLAKMLVSTDKNAEPLGKLINLIEDKSVHKHCIYYSSGKSDLGQNLVDDINLMQEAKDKNIPVADLIVKSYASGKEGVQNSKIGDVYSVGDEKNVYIKTDDENSKQLKFDKETYLKLFPPVERFALGQSQMGDCYLISVLDKLYQNPDTRVRILDCFEQDGNNVKATLPNSQKTMVAENCRLNNEDAYSDYNKRYFIKGADGLKILENLFGEKRTDSYIDTAKLLTYEGLDDTVDTELSNEDYTKFYEQSKQAVSEKKQRYRAELNYLENGGKIPEKAGFTREERVDFIKNELKNLRYESASITRRLNQELPETEKLMSKQLQRKDELYTAINDRENLWINQAEYYFIDVDDNGYFDKLHMGVEQDDYGVVFNKDVDKIKKNYAENTHYYRGSGGFGSETFKEFGLKAKSYPLNIPESVSDVMEKLKQNPDKYVLIADTKSDIPENMYKKNGVTSGHAYSLSVREDENGEMIFSVVNPWNTAFKTELSQEEFLKYYCQVHMAEK